MKKKDSSVKFDERIFGASQLLTFSVFLYVCMMPFLLALHSEVVGKIDFGKGEVFSSQTDAIWIIHGNMFKIMLLFFFRLMAIDMTLFQFIDWFLEQMDQEEIEEIKEEIKTLKDLEIELETAKPERKREIERQIMVMTSNKIRPEERKKEIER